MEGSRHCVHKLIIFLNNDAYASLIAAVRLASTAPGLRVQGHLPQTQKAQGDLPAGVHFPPACHAQPQRVNIQDPRGEKMEIPHHPQGRPVAAGSRGILRTAPDDSQKPPITK
jgi:hypothetical protein